jgi:hypothetical protein
VKSILGGQVERTGRTSRTVSETHHNAEHPQLIGSDKPIANDAAYANVRLKCRDRLETRDLDGRYIAPGMTIRRHQVAGRRERLAQNRRRGRREMIIEGGVTRN